MSSFYAQYPASSAGSNPSVGTVGNTTPSSATLVGGSDGTDLRALSVDATGKVNANVSSSVLPTGAATSANQDTEIASLSSIDTKLSAQATAANQATEISSLSSIDTKLSAQATAANQATEISSLSSIDTKLSSQATAAKQDTLAAKTSSADVVEAYDYRAFTYVAATTKIDTITYKSGGASGTTVATQTFGYDGSDRITSITKT